MKQDWGAREGRYWAWPGLRRGRFFEPGEVRLAILSLLAEGPQHGYEIMKELKRNFAVVSDPGTVYRVLRQLERDGYITSRWDSQEQGPARRVYSLTKTGNKALKAWSVALDQYRTSLDAFLKFNNSTWTKERPKPHEE